MADIHQDMVDKTLFEYAHIAPIDNVIGAVLSDTATRLGALYTIIQLLSIDYPNHPDDCDKMYEAMTSQVTYLIALNKYIVADIVIQRIRDECVHRITGSSDS